MRRWGWRGWRGEGGEWDEGGWGGLKSHLVTVDKCNLAVSVLPRASSTCCRCYKPEALLYPMPQQLLRSQMRLKSSRGMQKKCMESCCIESNSVGECEIQLKPQLQLHPGKIHNVYYTWFTVPQQATELVMFHNTF